MAIGSGIIFMPIQMGVKGIWVSLTSILIAYPAVYYISDIFLRSLSRTDACDDYTSIVTQYLGKNWGMALSVLYFLMLLKGMLAYSSTIVSDGASYLQTLHVTSSSIAATPWFIFGLIAIMVALASRGERFLFKVSGPMIGVKLAIILFLASAMLPYWNIANLGLHIVPDALSFIRDVWLTLPFAMLSIFFGQILNPMNVGFRKVEADSEIATYRALRASRLAFVVLLVGVGFFGLSFLLSINHEGAASALQQNISALALAAQVIPGDTVRILSIVLNLIAIFTAFFGIYLGFQDALSGIVINLVDRFCSRGPRFNRALPYLIAGLSILLLANWVLFGISAMLLMQITVPVFGLVACLIPVYLIFRVPALRDLKAWRMYYVLLFGLALLLVPVLKLFE
ncbi:hypothetical protein ACIQSO_01480 [Pseudomonas putida]|uniref:hypothetical protein n=1 Tax=Pseudomonas putida TaxID=303 RepID=UPI00383B2051